MVHFQGTDYRAHTSCISEAQKVQGQLYREKDKKGDKRKSTNVNDTMRPKRAYVEDAPEGDDSKAVAIVDVPPRAPTPPQSQDQLANVNVFDFLVTEDTPNGNKTAPPPSDGRRAIENVMFNGNQDSQYSQYSQDGAHYMQYGYSYGYAPLQPAFERYDSWQNLTDSQPSQALMPPPAYVTPAPKEHRREKKDAHTTEKSDKKRKRHQVEELDLSSAKRPSSRDDTMLDMSGDGRHGRVLHSGLTGGLNKLVTDPEFLDDRIDAGPTPILSPIKRSKREKDDKLEREEKKSRRASSYVSYSTTNSKPSTVKTSDRHDGRSRDVDRKYHDDRQHRRRHSSERVYYEDSRRHRDSFSSSDRPHGNKHLKAIEFPSSRPSSVQPSTNNQIVSYSADRADLFMSLITKGPDSERGCSINKVLKRYHRERHVRGSDDKDDEDKELWKMLRLRRNDRGEIVLFI
jgi:cell growth-regulating nucleolar protein